MTDREQIIDTVVRLFVATDERDWKGVERCFSDMVRFDMSSLGGGESQDLTPATIIAGWREGLEPIEKIHHQVGNFRVEKGRDEADVSCYGIAMHYREVENGRNVRTFVGSYDIHLVREGDDWHIDGFRFNLKFIDGNRELEAEP